MDNIKQPLSEDSREILAWCAANINKLSKSRKKDILNLLISFGYRVNVTGPSSVGIDETEFQDDDVKMLKLLVENNLM